MINKDDLLAVGKFQKTHALKGELNMISEIDPEYFMQGKPVIVNCDGIYVPFFTESIRQKGSTSYLVKLSGIDEEKEAAFFVNKEIYIPKEDAKELIEDSEISDDLIGYEIKVADSGEIIGTIESIDDTTENILFIIKDSHGELIYLPANEDFIEEINDEENYIIMNLPEGLIDLNKKE